MIVVAVDKNSVRADPPAEPQARSWELAGIDEIVLRQMLDQDPRTIIRRDLKRAVISAKRTIQHPAQNFAIHLQAVDQNRVDPALKLRGHPWQRSVIQHRIRDLAARKR